jgi:hypothetical protein
VVRSPSFNRTLFRQPSVVEIYPHLSKGGR